MTPKIRYNFWRTFAGKEIDFIEEFNGTMYGFECKWNTIAKQKTPIVFSELYPQSEIVTITPKNYLDFI